MSDEETSIYDDWDYRQLQAECKSRDLSARGRREILIDKLVLADRKEAGEDIDSDNDETAQNGSSGDDEDNDCNDENEDEDDDNDEIERREVDMKFDGSAPAVPSGLFYTKRFHSEQWHKMPRMGLDTTNFFTYVF